MQIAHKDNSPIRNLENRRKQLLQDFLAGEEKSFTRSLAEVLDEYFRESFSYSIVGPTMHMEKNPCAFVALGGYGRMEQCLHSDVDVLVLFDRTVPPQAEELLRETVYPLWDLGLEVGYATRTLKECRSQAASDFAVLTPLMDARFLCGFSPLYSKLVQWVREGFLPRHRRAFLEWLARSNQERHERFGDSAYLLEPDIKEGRGGLRDYHAMGWTAMARYQTRDLAELVEAGHLTAEECTRLHGALRFIWNVRNRLHFLTGRKSDRLYFEVQVEMARSLGFRDRLGRQAVEHYLGTLHGHMGFLKELYLGFASQPQPRRTFSLRRGPAPRLRTEGLKWTKGAVTFDSDEGPAAAPLLLLRIFEKSAHLGVPIAFEAKRLIRENLSLVDPTFRKSAPVIRSLRQILTAPAPVDGVLMDMFQTGLMVALFPETKRIVNLIQYDAYHVYPVDIHSVRTVQILKELAHPETDREADLMFLLYRELADPEPLLWAALFHDVGKGAVTPDHPIQGAKIASKVFARMSFPEEQVERIAFLIREHLTMRETATQRDIQEEKTVVRFARKFRDVEELTMLYLLTVADARATGPKAWSAWIDTLLRELFFKARNMIEKGDLASGHSADVVAHKRREIFRKAAKYPEADLSALFEKMSPRYLLYTSADDIVRHVDLHAQLDSKPVALDARHSRKGYRTVTVCARDRAGLFSSISGVLALNNLDVLEAHIHTWGNGVALDIFVVKPPPDNLHEEETWRRVERDLEAVLSGELQLEEALGKKYTPRKTRSPENPNGSGKTVVDNKASDFFTIVEVYTRDYPGLLHSVTHTLFNLDLDVRIAKITTKVDEVLDVFYVQDQWGQKVTDPTRVRHIEETIEGALQR